MNDRIAKLIEECTDRHFSEGGGFETFDKEKFAELVWKAAYEEGHDVGVDAGFEAGRNASFTEQNFGVEE